MMCEKQDRIWIFGFQIWQLDSLTCQHGQLRKMIPQIFSVVVDSSAEYWLQIIHHSQLIILW